MLMGELLSGDPCHFWATEMFRVIVTDEDGLVLVTLELGAVHGPAVAARAARQA